MSDEHLYFSMDESSEEMMLVDATGLGSELEIAADYEEPPLTMHLSNLPIRDGLDIGHDGGGNETSDDDSLESYLQSPNQAYDDGFDSRHEEEGSSSDGSVEYPSFSMQSSHLSFKGRLGYRREEHEYGLSDEDSSESPSLSTKSSNFSDEGRMDVMHNKGEKTISNNCGVSYRPFIVKIPSLSLKNTIDYTDDKAECENAANTSLNDLPPNIVEISHPDRKDVLEPKLDEGVSETSSSDCAEISPFSSNMPSFPDKDGSSNEDDSLKYENLNTSPLSTNLQIAFNDNLGSLDKEDGEVTSDDSSLEHKPLKVSDLDTLSNNNEMDHRNKEVSELDSDKMNVKDEHIFKSKNFPIKETMCYGQNKIDDNISDDCKLKLSPLKKKSFSLPPENKLDDLNDVNVSGILPVENVDITLIRQSSSLSVKDELNFVHCKQEKISDVISSELTPFEANSCTLPNDNLKDLNEKGSISTSVTIHSTAFDNDINTSSLTKKSKNSSSVDRLDCMVNTEKSKALEGSLIESSCNSSSCNRLNVKYNPEDSETLGGNTLDISSTTKLLGDPIEEKQEDNIEESIVLNKDHSKFLSSQLSENRLNIVCVKNEEIPSESTADLSLKSPCISVKETLDTTYKKSDDISNSGVELLPFTSDKSNDELCSRQSKEDNTSSNDDIQGIELHALKLPNENEKEKGVKELSKNIINSEGESVDLPSIIMKSSNVKRKNELDFAHDRGGNETSDDENLEPPKKMLKGIDSSNIRSSKKVHFDSDNSASYDGFNCQFSNEEKMQQCSEMDYDNIADNLNSNHTGMMEFDILDEFESNDNDNDDKYSDCETDISLDELDAMLEAGYKNPTNANKGDHTKDDELGHEEKEKVILKVRGKDHFDVLPEGWVEVTHNSGMPIYLHRVSRVCCVSKPYFLGPGSTRKHEIPISAIPCLNYLRELEKEKNQAQEAEDKSNGEKFPPAKLECVKETKESGSLDYLAVREYCRKRFEFQTITVKRFKTWAGRRKHQKQLRLKQRPSLPDNTKLITCPLPPASDKANTTGAITKKEFIMNPSGKSPVCILHEYVQHTLRVQPRYIFKELENASTPYGAVVVIGGIEYGSGYGSSKKQAKSEAAKAALDVLIPKMKMFPPDDPLADIQEDVEFFDQVRVEDPRVSELSIKAGQPYPFQILLECLKRNYGMGDTEIDITMKNLKHQKNEFIMKVGKHSVSVICKNKRDGKHRASQAILQLLHPHITTWGSLLRMYGKGSCKTLKEKKEEEQRITELQSQACANKPNLSILRKLKEEMLKYREKMKMKKPIGKLIPEHLELSTSDSNLKNVEL